MPPFYITTPIYYVNDKPHIGHCYSTTVADAIARFERLRRGDPASVFFLTGTDEHADKVVTSAAEHDHTPQSWADRNAEEFKKAFAFMGVSNDDFIRTTEPRHKDKVPVYIKRLMDSGDIYRGEFTGWYDTSEEAYVTETEARDHDYKSKVNGKPLVKRTEPCYFFRLGKYQQRLLEHIQNNPRFVQPDSRRQEVLGRLRPPAVLNDVPVSRPVTADPATQWGIRIPGDDANRVYVWIDALFNYLTVVDNPQRRAMWPASVHLIGKDILWFHAVIWPALLMALGEPLPGTIFGHGWWISEGQKMSKTLGNFIDLDKLRSYAEKHGLDSLRWYLLTQGPLSGADADFSHAKFIEVYNSDLANGIGNCASRVGNMVDKYFGGALPDPHGVYTWIEPNVPSGASKEAMKTAIGVPNDSAVLRSGTCLVVTPWADEIKANVDKALAALDAHEVGTALLQGIEIVRKVDGFINLTRPFSIAKTMATNPDAAKELGAILYCCAEAVRIASILLSPALTGKMPALWTLWGCTPPPNATLASLCEFAGPHALKPGQRIGKGEIMFMRAEA
ncbi:MAG: methionine--tRNA ligase [Planctomycetes bacterium]|nr:methionine--tRNA ligase [Planctomycetota bacterium]